MSKLLYLLILLCSSSLFAKDVDPLVTVITPLQVGQLYSEQHAFSTKDFSDLVDKEEKVSRCMSEYIKVRIKSYSRNVQNDLYDLMNNFKHITSRVYGKQQMTDEVPFVNKITALARVQCDAYYAMGVLK